MNIKRKVHNEYVSPVMVYGSETWALKKATWNYCQSHSEKWSASSSASPYATTNVIPGYDITPPHRKLKMLHGLHIEIH